MAGLDGGRVVVWILFAVLLVAIGASLGLGFAKAASAGRRKPGPADIRFAQDMATHHAELIRLTTLVPAHSRNPVVRQFAADLETQLFERLGRMRGWLSLWGEPEQADDPAFDMADEAARLRGLPGPRFDTLFARLAVRLAEGGIDIAQATVDSASLSVVRDLADDVEVSLEDAVQALSPIAAARRA